MDNEIPKNMISVQGNNHFGPHFQPKANVAINKTTPDKQAPSPNIPRRSNFNIKSQGKQRYQRYQCTICHYFHHETECPLQEPEWIPLWMRQNITKYNALHKDKPKKEIIEADPPPKRAISKFQQKANAGIDVEHNQDHKNESATEQEIDEVENSQEILNNNENMSDFTGMAGDNNADFAGIANDHYNTYQILQDNDTSSDSNGTTEF